MKNSTTLYKKYVPARYIWFTINSSNSPYYFAIVLSTSIPAT